MERHKNKDIILWSELKNGDVDALGKLYDIYIDDLFSYGMQISNDRSRIMDCIHDLFLDLYKYKAKLASTDNVKYYLLKSLKRKIFKKQTTKLISLSNHSFIQKQDAQYYSKSVEENLIISEYIEERSVRLSQALNFLSKKQRIGLFLRFNEERQYEEIAQIMNVSIPTSRTIIYRAIKSLRNSLT